MNTITAVLILIVAVFVIAIGVALIFILRSFIQTHKMDGDESMSLKDREKHIDTLLKEFEKQMGDTGDQDEQGNET